MHIITCTADRQRIQPFIYLPGEDILLRTKDPVDYRKKNGQPEAIGCLLLYFLLRHNRMLSISNVKAASFTVDKDPRSGWKAAIKTINPGLGNPIKLQKWPIIKSHTTTKDKEELEQMEKEMEQKFGTVCKSFMQRLRDSTISEAQP